MKQLLKNVPIILNSIINPKRNSKVIYYHDIHDRIKYTQMSTSLTIFEKHIQVIKNIGYSIETNITSNENQLKLCFDDGFRGLWDCRAFFYEHNLRPTIFVSNSLIGKPNYLNLDEILELQKNGFIFEGHSWSHSNLTKYSTDELKHELYDSRIKLSDILGKEVTELCFPQGYYNDLVVTEALKGGYNTLYTSDPKPFNPRNNQLIGRYLLQFSKRNEVKGILLGGQDWMYNHYKNIHFQNKL